MSSVVTLPSQRGTESNTSSSEAMRSNRRVSCFDASLISSKSIRKRELHSFSVHFNVSTSKWVATLARPEVQAQRNGEKRRCVSFSFPTERDARKFAKMYTPPKMMTGASVCVCCQAPFDNKCRSNNCRNCGSQICDKCSTRWGIRMIPKTYLGKVNSLTARVCKSCDWISNAFCMALLQGNYEQALSLHATGNVNLRSTFADIHKEAMFPIHCAVRWSLMMD